MLASRALRRDHCVCLRQGARILGTRVRVLSSGSPGLGLQGPVSRLYGHGIRALGQWLGRRAPQGFAIRRGDFSHLQAGV